jgi:uncharacterized protein YggE
MTQHKIYPSRSPARRRVWPLAAAAMVLCFAASAWAQSLPRTITVQGMGQIAATPDVASVTIGVVTEDREPAAALAENNTAMDKLFAILKRFKVAEKDRRTSGFSVSPQSQRSNDRTGPSFIVGYRVTNQVTVKYRNLKNLGRLLTALVEDGANRINGIGFTFDDPEKLRNDARRAAVADARRRAELYAAESKSEIGRVLQITELSVAFPRPIVGSMATMERAAPVPVAPGEQSVSASVTVVYSIAPDEEERKLKKAEDEIERLKNENRDMEKLLKAKPTPAPSKPIPDQSRAAPKAEMPAPPPPPAVVSPPPKAEPAPPAQTGGPQNGAAEQGNSEEQPASDLRPVQPMPQMPAAPPAMPTVPDVQKAIESLGAPGASGTTEIKPETPAGQ